MRSAMRKNKPDPNHPPVPGAVLKPYADLAVGSQFHAPGHPQGGGVMRKSNMDDGYEYIAGGEWRSDDTFPPKGDVWVVLETGGEWLAPDDEDVPRLPPAKFFSCVPEAGWYEFDQGDYQGAPVVTRLEILQVLEPFHAYTGNDDEVLLVRETEGALTFLTPSAWSYYGSLPFRRVLVDAAAGIPAPQTGETPFSNLNPVPQTGDGGLA